MRGDNWRILAHSKDGKRAVDLQSAAAGDASARFAKKHGLKPSAPTTIESPVPFETVIDEMVINPWFHLEEMDRGVWWMRVGGYHLWVRVAGDGSAKVTHEGEELSTYGLLGQDAGGEG